jgi:hypothetical protein
MKRTALYTKKKFNGGETLCNKQKQYGKYFEEKLKKERRLRRLKKIDQALVAHH